MGHNVVIGAFEAGPGTSAICRVPELPADPETCRLSTPAKVLVLPMDGPAFYGFEVLTEAEAMTELLAARPIDYDARNERRRLAMDTDAEEVARIEGNHGASEHVYEEDDDGLF
jgi:hypothetical protein